MKIAHRLILMISTALLALVLVAGVNLYQSNQVYEAADYANENTVPSLVAINKAVVWLGRLRVRIDRHAITDELAAKTDQLAKIKESRESLEQAVKEYEPFISDAEDKRLWDQDRALLAEYLTAADQVLVSSASGDRKGTFSLLVDSAPLAQRLTGAFDDHIRYNVKLGQEGAANALAAKHMGTVIGFAVLGTSVVVLALLGLATLAAVSRQLARANAMTARIADGDLRRDEHRQPLGNDEISELLASLERMRERLAETLSGVIRAADSVHLSATSLSTATTQASAAGQLQSHSSSEAAAAIEELTVSIDQVSTSAGEAKQHADESRELAQRSGARVEAATSQVGEVANRVEFTAKQVGGLSNDVQEIGNITVVIREVAEQTNLLALNAAIEAARAGEQGRGFAVVADEVRKLAERTTSSVQNISKVIQRIQEGSSAVVASMDSSRRMVGEVVDSAQVSGRAMQDIVGSADTLRHAIASISAALEEQRLASSEVARNVEAIAQMSEQNSAAVNTVAETANDLRTVADGLQARVAAFRI
jgi:methyl-accepting chemotaxis protein